MIAGNGPSKKGKDVMRAGLLREIVVCNSSAVIAII